MSIQLVGRSSPLALGAKTSEPDRGDQVHSHKASMKLISQGVKSSQDLLEIGLLSCHRILIRTASEKEQAKIVAKKRGKPIILVIRAEMMHQDGLAFFLSRNGVWLTDSVPVNYIQF